MGNLEKSTEDYLSRINSVILYIEKNLDSVLDLETISRHANFSPFHFHRIFTALIGETPADYILRIRTEKAARLLQEDKTIPIVEIAYRCGFTNQTSFSRAFRKYFSTTAHEFRKQEKAVFSRNKQFYNSLGECVERTNNAINHKQTDSSILACIIHPHYLSYVFVKKSFHPFNLTHQNYTIVSFKSSETASIFIYEQAEKRFLKHYQT